MVGLAPWSWSCAGQTRPRLADLGDRRPRVMLHRAMAAYPPASVGGVSDLGVCSLWTPPFDESAVSQALSVCSSLWSGWPMGIIERLEGARSRPRSPSAAARLGFDERTAWTLSGRRSRRCRRCRLCRPFLRFVCLLSGFLRTVTNEASFDSFTPRCTRTYKPQRHSPLLKNPTRAGDSLWLHPCSHAASSGGAWGRQSPEPRKTTHLVGGLWCGPPSTALYGRKTSCCSRSPSPS